MVHSADGTKCVPSRTQTTLNIGRVVDLMRYQKSVVNLNPSV